MYTNVHITTFKQVDLRLLLRILLRLLLPLLLRLLLSALLRGVRFFRL